MFDNIWLWLVQYFEKLDTKQIVSNWNENACMINQKGHSVYFNTAVTSPEIFWKLRFWTKKRARSISYDHIKMMQSMVYLISLYTLILIKWHVTSPEILTTYGIMNEWILNTCTDVFSAIKKTQLHPYIVLIIIIKDCLASCS